jgi:hypothetical protein
MSTHRSNDRSSLFSFTFADTRLRPWCPVAPAFRGASLSLILAQTRQTQAAIATSRCSGA